MHVLIKLVNVCQSPFPKIRISENLNEEIIPDSIKNLTSKRMTDLEDQH